MAATVTPNEARKHGLVMNQDGVRRTAYQLLADKDTAIETLARIWPELASIDPKTAERLETEAHYAVYLDRQKSDVDQARREEARQIPDGIDFSSTPGLSNEIKQKLAMRRPASLAEAQRIDGMTPAALAIIVVQVRQWEQAHHKGAA